jgi:hypothetical protein
MDRNSVIGLVLIGLILSVFAIMNQPSEEEIKKQEKEIALQEKKEKQAEKTKTVEAKKTASEVKESNNSSKTVIAKEDGGSFATLDESGLRSMMQNPKYWRDRDPAFIAKVSEGFQRIYKA